MRIEPYTDEQLFELEKKEQVDLSRPVEFLVTECTQGESSKGNDMFSVDMDIYQDGYKKASIKDWIIFNTGKSFPEMKAKRFYQSMGREEEYKGGNINAALLARAKAKGICKLKQEDYVTQDGKSGKAYRVDFYIKPDGESGTSDEKFYDDDLPNL